MSPLLDSFGGLSARAFGFKAAASLPPTSVDYLVVAGGAGGASDFGGGGGAGGYRTSTAFAVSGGSS